MRLWERTREGRARLGAARWGIVQCTLAAMLAWHLATAWFEHPQPFFAPVAAVLSLGVGYAYRLRRVLELAAGVTLGVAVADLLVQRIGPGTWQIGLTIVLALTLAQLLGGSALVTSQAAVQAVILVALPAAGGGLARWQDALVGGTCALAVAVLLPPDPTSVVRRHAQGLIRELAAVVTSTAEAIRTGDPAPAELALDRARRTQVGLDRWDDVLRGAEEIARLSPLRRNRRAELRRHRSALTGLDRATRNLRVATRRVTAVLDTGRPVPAALGGVLLELADILAVLQDEVGRDPSLGTATHRLLQLARRLDPRELEAATVSATVVVAQVRSAVVDLFMALGYDWAEARQLLPQAHLYGGGAGDQVSRGGEGGDR